MRKNKVSAEPRRRAMSMQEKRVSAEPKRAMSMQETRGKSVIKENLMKSVRAVSATERPDSLRKDGKKVEDSVKMARVLKDTERIQQKTSSSSPKLGKKKSDVK